MRTQRIQLYSLTELPTEQAQERAVDKLRELDYCGVEESSMRDMFTEYLKLYGLPTDEIEWSLSSCQGDGVAFYGDIDIEAMLVKLDEWDEYKELVNEYELSATSTRNSWGNHYSHWNTMDVYMQREKDYRSTPHRVHGAKLWELVKDTVVTVSKELERMGYKEIEYRQSKEQIIECAEINELEFRADGRLWHG